MVTVPLDQRIPITLSGAGGGTAQAGPRNLRETWYPTTVSVKVATNVAEASCQVYQGPDTSQPYFVDGTLSGSTGDSTSNVSGPLGCGEYVFAKWTGGDAGAQATMRIQGTRTIA